MTEVKDHVVTNLFNLVRPAISLFKHLRNRVAQAREVLRIKAAANLVSERNVTWIRMNLAPVRVVLLHCGVNEDRRLERGKRELLSNTRPVSKQQVSRENRSVGAEVGLKGELLWVRVSVASKNLLHAGRIALQILWVWADHNAPAAAHELLKQAVKAAVHQVVILPRRTNQQQGFLARFAMAQILLLVVLD